MSQEDHFNKGGHGFAPDDENRRRQGDSSWHPFNADQGADAGNPPATDDILPPLQVLKDPYDSMADRHETAKSFMSTQGDRVEDAGIGAAQGLSGAQAVVIDNSAADQFAGGVMPDNRMANLDFSAQNEPLASTTGHVADGVGGPPSSSSMTGASISGGGMASGPSTASPMPGMASGASFGSPVSDQHTPAVSQPGPAPSSPMAGTFETGSAQDGFGTVSTGFDQGQVSYDAPAGTPAPGRDVLPPQAANPLAGGMDPFNSEADRHDMSVSAMSNKGEQFDTFGVRESSAFSKMDAVAVDTSAADRFSGGPSGDEKISGLGFSAKGEELGSTTSGSESHAPSAQQMHQPGLQSAGAGNIGTVDFAQQGGFGGTEEKKESFANTAGAGLQSTGKSGSAWSMTEGMATSGQAQNDHIKHVHVSKKIQENIDQAKEAYTQAKADYAEAEHAALETLDDSRWSSEGASAAAFAGGEERAEGFKEGMETGVDGLDAAGVSDSRDFGFMSSSEREAAGDSAGRVGVRRSKSGKKADGESAHGQASGHEARGVAAANGSAAVESAKSAPANVRTAARNAAVQKQKVKKASDELVAAHQEAAEFITKAERRAQTAANFKSAGKNAVLNAAVDSIGDSSVGGKALRGSVRGGIGAARAIKSHRGKAGKAAGAVGAMFSGLAEEDDESGFNSAIGAVRSAKDIKNAVKGIKGSREKTKAVADVSKKAASKGFQTAAEKKAATAVAQNVQASAMKSMMQRRSMNIAQKLAAARSESGKGALLKRLGSGLAKAGKAAAAAIKSLLSSLASSLSSLIGGVVASIGAAGAAIVVVLIILIFVVVFGGGGSTTKKVEGLNEVETQVAEFFREKGLPDVQIAAIMGNMAAESTMNPGSEEGGGVDANGIGLCQWTNGRHTNLVNYAKSVGKSWTDVGVQLDFFWDHDKWQTNWLSGYYTNTNYNKNSHINFSEDPTPGSWVEGSKAKFMAATDVKDAVRQFCYGWEVAGIPRLKVRYDAAEKYLDALQNGGDSGGDGEVSGNASQQSVVAAAKSTPSPGQGLCAAWVSNVFRNAGLPFYGGNACDMCRKWCHSNNRADLKVGMIIADVSHPGTGAAGLTYGHVGIYIGNNQVMSNEGPITTKSLDQFIGFYGKGTGCYWGWIGGVDLSKR